MEAHCCSGSWACSLDSEHLFWPELYRQPLGPNKTQEIIIIHWAQCVLSNCMLRTGPHSSSLEEYFVNVSCLDTWIANGDSENFIHI